MCQFELKKNQWVTMIRLEQGGLIKLLEETRGGSEATSQDWQEPPPPSLLG